MGKKSKLSLLVHGHKNDLPYITCIFHLLKYSTANAEPSLEHPSPRFTLACSLKMITAIGVFLPIFRVITGVQLPTAVNTARRCVQTPRIPMVGHGGPRWSMFLFLN